MHPPRLPPSPRRGSKRSARIRTADAFERQRQVKKTWQALRLMLADVQGLALARGRATFALPRGCF